jgi:hypothetical protein
MRALLLAAILSSAASLLGPTPRPSLTGTVLDSNGSPLAGAAVMVYHAGVMVGYTTFCPSCYIDCGKRGCNGLLISLLQHDSAHYSKDSHSGAMPFVQSRCYGGAENSPRF